MWSSTRWWPGKSHAAGGGDSSTPSTDRQSGRSDASPAARGDATLEGLRSRSRSERLPPRPLAAALPRAQNNGEVGAADTSGRRGAASASGSLSGSDASGPQPGAARGGGRRFPTLSALDVAGVSLQNTFMAGPTRPTQLDMRLRPEADELLIGIPEADEERIRLAGILAGQVEGHAKPAPEGASVSAAGRHKSLLRRAGESLAKAGRRLGRQVPGVALPITPMLKNVVAVGKGKSRKTVPHEESKASDQRWQQRTQDLLQERRYTDVKAQMEVHRLNATDAPMDALKRLRGRTQGRETHLLDGLTDHVLQQSRLREKWSMASQQDALAQWQVARRCREFGVALAAQAQIAARREQIDQQASLIELRRTACLEALSAGGGGGIAPPQETLAQARAEVDRLGVELVRCVERRSDADMQVQRARVREAIDALETHHPSQRPTEVAVNLDLCRKELAAARARVERLESFYANGGESSVKANHPDLAEARNVVKELMRWKSELEGTDRAGQARALLAGPTRQQVDQSMNQLSRQERAYRRAWAAAAGRLARLEVQSWSAAAAPADPTVSRSGHATVPDGVDRAGLARRARELGDQRAQAYGEADALEDALSERQIATRSQLARMTVAMDELPRIRAEVLAAEAALSGHAQALRPLEPAVRAASIVEEAHARAARTRDAVARSVQDLEKQAEQIGRVAAGMQGLAMMTLAAAPPGFTAPDAAIVLGPVLERLQARLLAQPPRSEREALPADAMLEMALRAAARLSGGDAHSAARTLAALLDLRLEDLVPAPDAVGAPGGASAAAAALAHELVTLPRGRTLLTSLMVSSPASHNAERAKSVEVYVAAQGKLALGGQSLDEATRTWLTQAMSGASACMHDPEGRIEAHAARAAYHGVRNGFYSVAPGSPYHQADTCMRSVSERMLDHAVQAKTGSSAKQVASKVLPLNKPTPFNEPAMLAAGKAAVAVGIIDTQEQALQALSDAARELHAELGAASSGPTADLVALLDAVQAECRTRKPEQVLADTTLSSRHAAGAAAAMLPLDAARALLQSMKDESSSSPINLNRLETALKRADASRLMSAPRSDSVQDQDNFFTSLMNNFQLRDKLKIAGGRIMGASTAGLAATDNFIPTAGVAVQLDLRRTQQKDEVLEVNLGPQTIYLLIGGQSTKLSRVGGGAGASFGVASVASVLAASVRPLGIDWRRTKDVQSQTGISLRVLRSNATQTEDLAGFNAAISSMLKWREARRPDGSEVSGPLEVLLSEHPQVSVNLLGDYERRSVRHETIVQTSAALSVPFVTVTGGAAASARNWAMDTFTTEETGHIRLQEQKKLVQAVRQAGGAMGVRVGLLSTVDTPVGLSAPGARWARMFDLKTRGVEKIVRLTTVDGALVPHMCRHVIEYAGVDAYVNAIQQNRRAWVNQALIYGHFPEDWPNHLRQLEAERELDEFIAELKAKKNEFMVCQLTHGLTDDLVPQVDALRGLMEIARRAGDAAGCARHEKRMDDLLADPKNWKPGRLIVTERSTRMEQPGVALGVVAQSSSVAEASHAVMMFPKYPADLAEMYPSEITTGFATTERVDDADEE